MAELIVYGLCDANCKHRVLTKDQTESLIQAMAANGFEVPENFKPTTAVNGIVEQNTGKIIKLWQGTSQEWNDWTGDKTDVYPIKTDDTGLGSILKTLGEILDGSLVVPNAQNVLSVDFRSNKVARFEDYIVPKKKLLWSGEVVLGGTSSFHEVVISLGNIVGKTFEIEYIPGNKIKKKVKIQMSNKAEDQWLPLEHFDDGRRLEIRYYWNNPGNLKFTHHPAPGGSLMSYKCYITAIYEVVE